MIDIEHDVNVSRLIDHTLLRPDAVEADIVRLCDEAEEYRFFSVCVHPCMVKKAYDALFRTHVKVAAVVGFPLGVTLPEVKVYEAIQTVLNGADELDIVMNIGRAKEGDWSDVEKEISDIITATKTVTHKIIIEACYLTDNEKRNACTAVMNGGAEFIKTSTGFGPSGAVIEDIELIRSVTEGKTGIKAAGGIRRLEDVRAFVRAGATRIGTSSGVEIMKEIESKKTNDK